MRLSSLKIGSLCVNKSRTSLEACLSSSVREVSVRGLRIQGANDEAKDVT